MLQGHLQQLSDVVQGITREQASLGQQFRSLSDQARRYDGIRASLAGLEATVKGLQTDTNKLHRYHLIHFERQRALKSKPSFLGLTRPKV